MSKTKWIDESGVEKTAMQEKQRKQFLTLHEDNRKAVLAKVASDYNIAEIEKVVDFNRPNFSIKAFREASYALSKRLREAQSESVFGQLLRAGVLNQFNDIYQAVEVTYDAVVRQTSSNKRQEFYSPLERVGFPKLTERGDKFPEQDFKGIDIEMINNKYGMMLAVERELVDDDQTGQIVQKAGQMGENARIQEEAIVWGTIAGTAGSFDGEAIPVSKTYPTPYVNGVPGVSGGLSGSGKGVNALGGSGYTAGRLSQATIQSAWILAKKMLDQSGRPMLVMPSILAVSPQDVFYAQTLLNSDYNPSMASTATGDIGKTGGNFAINPIKNMVGIVATRFLPDYASLLIDPGKGFAFQRRDATEVVQENPQSGPAFSQEIFRYKLRTRWVADFIDPKFMINLNPGYAST